MIDEELIGPCGMNCGICGSFLAKKFQVPRRRGIITYCDGCKPRDKKCAFLKKRCEKLLHHEIDYCYECEEFPCQNLKNIDENYRKKYAYPYSMINTLIDLKKHGIKQVLETLSKSNTCNTCGELLCIHNGLCYNCDKKTIANMKNYRND